MEKEQLPLVRRLIDLTKKLAAATSGKVTDNSRVILEKDVYYIARAPHTGRLSLRKAVKPVKTTWDITGSIAVDKLGIHDARIAHISLSGTAATFTPKELRYLFGTDVIEMVVDRKGKLKPTPKVEYSTCVRFVYGEYNRWTLDPNPTMPDYVLQILWSLLKEKTLSDSLRGYGRAITAGNILPAHPSWVFERRGDLKGVNVLWAPGNQWKLHRSIFYRAGKDIWKAPIAKRSLRMLVVETPKGSHDGNMWVAGARDKSYLVRSLLKGRNATALLKGRCFERKRHKIKLPDGGLLPADVDGWTSTHNIKWLASDALKGCVGKVLTFNADVVSDEAGDESGELFTMRKLSILALLFCKFLPGLHGIVSGAFKKNASVRAKQAKGFKQGWFDMITELLEEESGAVMVNTYAKLLLGLADAVDLARLYTNFLRKLTSIKMKGAWMEAYASDHVGRNVVHIHPADYREMMKRNASTKRTSLRYPITGYQSFFTHTIKADRSVPKGAACYNPSDAEYMRLDGDDHILMSDAYSAFEGGEEVVTSREAITSLPFEGISVMQLYTGGAKAQGIIGFVFNSMVAAKDTGDEALATRLGNLVDLSAQAIKKPYKLDLSALVEAKGLDEKLSNLGCIATKKDLVSNAKALWGAELPLGIDPGTPEVMPNMPHADDVVVEQYIDSITELASGMSNDVFDFCKLTINGRVLMDAVRAWYAKLSESIGKTVNDETTAGTDEELKAIQTVSRIAFELSLLIPKARTKDETFVLKRALASIDGTLVLAGYLSAGNNIGE